MKKKTATWYRKKCVERAKKEAKERDNYTCQHCGKKVEGYEAHGSHILNEGTYISMSATPDNIICLCYRCHIYWWHKNPLEAAAWFEKKWPGRYHTLQVIARDMKVVNWKKQYETCTKTPPHA